MFIGSGLSKFGFWKVAKIVQKVCQEAVHGLIKHFICHFMAHILKKLPVIQMTTNQFWSWGYCALSKQPALPCQKSILVLSSSLLLLMKSEVIIGHMQYDYNYVLGSSLGFYHLL